MPRFKEDFHPLPAPPTPGPLRLSQAGVTRPDPTYRIEHPRGAPYHVFEYIVSGRGHLRYGKRTFAPAAGDAYVLRPRVPRAYGSDPDDPWEKIWFNIGGPVVDRLLEAYRLPDDGCYEACGLGDAFREALAVVAEAGPDAYARLALALHRIVQGLHAHAERRRGGATPEGLALKALLDRRWREPVGTRELCAAVHKSPAQMQRIFRRDWGTSPYHYLQEVRLHFARQYLEGTDLPVRAVADRTGFRDAFYFSNWFKAKAGASPAAYRESFRRRNRY